VKGDYQRYCSKDELEIDLENQLNEASLRIDLEARHSSN